MSNINQLSIKSNNAFVQSGANSNYTQTLRTTQQSKNLKRKEVQGLPSMISQNLNKQASNLLSSQASQNLRGYNIADKN